MDVVNVVIVSNETQYKVKIKNKLVGDDIAIVGYADFKEEAKLKIEGYVPDIIVFAADTATIDEEALNFIKTVQYQNTGAGIILVTDKPTIALVNESAKIGIRQVFDLNIDANDFSNAIREVYALEQQLMGQLNISKRVRSKVFCFYGVKGGSGTSTIVANTAVALANVGKKALIIDLDLQFGDANLFLNIEPKDTIVELSRDPDGISIERINATVEMHSLGFSVLCAPKTPEYADYVNVSHIEKLIENVRPYFEYILIDLGTNYADSTLAALRNCDEIHMITNLDLPSLKNLKATMNILSTLRIDNKVKLVITKNRPSLIKVTEFENLIQKKNYAVIVSDRATCDKAMNSGIPFVLSSPRSAISKDIVKYTNQIIEDKEKNN